MWPGPGKRHSMAGFRRRELLQLQLWCKLVVVSNYRDGLFYSYFGLSGPGGPMVSDIIFTQSLLTIRLGLVLTWSHGLCNFVSLSSLLNLVLVSLGLMVSFSHILLSFILSWPYQNIFWTQWTHWSHDVFLVS